ncbi:hypothetical protein GCM10020256_36720 [Streptomyces thermocoprophilus]
MTDPPSERTPDAAPALEGAPDAEPEQPALRLLSPAQAAAELSAAGEAARGFLGLDPVTQNAALLGRELAHRDAVVLRYGETLLGCAVNPEQPRQAEVAVTAADAPAMGGAAGVPADVPALLVVREPGARRPGHLSVRGARLPHGGHPARAPVRAGPVPRRACAGVDGVTARAA